MEHPFYLTWSKQIGGVTYPLESVKSHYLVSDGNEKIDLASISYQASFGLTPDFIIKEVIHQLNEFSITSPKAVYKLKTQVTEELISKINLNGGKIFYTVSGAESVENALKIARIYSGKKTILARRPSYHGGTLAAVSVTGDWRNKDVPTLDHWTIRIPEPHEDLDLKKTKKIIEENDDFAAMILETVPGNNGVLIPPKDWIQGLQKLCNENNILFILDEVICGFYRLGTPFGFQKFNLKPDIITLAKGITGGVIPFGAVWTCPEIYDFFKDNILSCGLTNYAHPLGLRAMKAVLEYTSSKLFLDGLNTLIKEFDSDLSSLKHKTRTIGLLGAIDIKDAPTWEELWNKGLSLVCQKDRLILAPHLNLPVEVWKKSFKILEDALE